MRSIIDAALAAPRLILLLLLVTLGVGSYTYATIAKESDPDVPIPIVLIQVNLDGIAPLDSERLLVRPLEQAVRTIEGIKEMSATAGQGYASVTLQFEAGLDSDKSLAEVRRKVDEVRDQLPAEADEPTVKEFNTALFPVLTIVLSGPLPERTLAEVARLLRSDILAVKGVLDAKIAGIREEMIEITVDPLKMEAYGLGLEELFTIFSRNNRLIAAGVIDTGNGRFAIKLPGTIETAADIENLPVKVVGNRVVRFADVAQVTRSFKDRSSYARFNGQPALTLEVSKRVGSNIINTISAVREVVKTHQKQWPQNIVVDYSQDNSQNIKEMLVELQNGVFLAVVLVVLVLIFTIGWRSALLVAVAIPGSFLAGIMALAAFGMTVNLVVLFGLIMAVGMLVDDAIIVAEYADRKMAEGLPSHIAYQEATHRMTWPIVASTATRLVVFAPLLFWPGIVGGYMKYLPITLIATLTASLVMALIFIPVLGSLYGKSGAHSESERERTAAAEIGDLNRITGFTAGYLSVLRGAVRHPRSTFAAGVVLLITIFGAYHFFGAGTEFFPNGEPNNVRVAIFARGDLSVAQKDAITTEVENRIKATPGIKSFYTRSGRTGDSDPADQIGVINIELAEWSTRKPGREILADIREITKTLPGVRIDTAIQRNGPGSGKPVELEISTILPLGVAETNLKLAAAADALEAGMQAVGGFTDIEDTRPPAGIEWQLSVNRAEAAQYGVDISLIGTAVQLVTGGVMLGKTRPDDIDDEIDIRARYTPMGRNLDQLRQLKISTPSGMVPIANFVTQIAAPKVTSIRRVGGRRVINVLANVAPKINVNQQTDALLAHFKKHPDPRITDGVRFRFKGDQENQAEAANFLGKAFSAALFFMVIILVSQFNSFFQTALILSAILFSTGAVLLGLMIIRAPFGVVMGGIGIIALAGVIVNNNIILIDTYNHLRDQGQSAEEAILRTGAMRLRPVLLTAVTAILGLLPMAFGFSLNFFEREVTIGAPSSIFWVQLSSAVAGGLAFATPITLILTPALLMWRDGKKPAKAIAPLDTASDLA